MERFKFHEDGSVFFVTFSVVDWLPIFVSDPPFRIVTDSLNFCHKQKGLRVNAYVIMPTHLHAIVFHESFKATELESVLLDFRKYTGRLLADFIDRHFPKSFCENIRAAAGTDRDRRLWQPSLHPVQIETERFWNIKFDYLHDNPVRKGLVKRPDYWRYSSASYWMLDRAQANDVVLSAIDW